MCSLLTNFGQPEIQILDFNNLIAIARKKLRIWMVEHFGRNANSRTDCENRKLFLWASKKGKWRQLSGLKVILSKYLFSITISLSHTLERVKENFCHLAVKSLRIRAFRCLKWRQKNFLINSNVSNERWARSCVTQSISIVWIHRFDVCHSADASCPQLLQVACSLRRLQVAASL